MKLILIGSNSIHVKHYIKNIKPHVSELVLISESYCECEGINRQHVTPFRLKSIFRFYQFYKTIKKEITFGSAHIHIHQINRLAVISVLANRTSKRSIITTAWGSDVLIIPKQNLVFKTMVQFVLKYSTICTADSKEIIHEIKKISPLTRCEWLQYGFDPITPKIKENIIFSNRLHKPIYRIEAIIHYFNTFSKRYPNWKLVIAGTGMQTNTLKALTAALDLNSKIEFIGWLSADQNREWYAKSKIFVSIPKSDGTSVSVLEAMSAECVLVLSDIPVTHEWLTVNTGIMERPGINPFFDALELCASTTLQQNKNYVDAIAARSISIQKFLSLYKELPIS
jgi:glycosyltransferase involved in cell wall biosynthesis